MPKSSEEICLCFFILLVVALIFVYWIRNNTMTNKNEDYQYEKEKNYNKNPLMQVFEIGLDKKQIQDFLVPENPGNEYRFNKGVLNNNNNNNNNNNLNGWTLNEMVLLQANPPPSQPFIPSPPYKNAGVPYEMYGASDANGNVSNFNKFKNAYNPQIMDLPPVVPRARLLPPDEQALDPYSGYPVSTYLTDENFNKFYSQFVPDYLWCKSGVCENNKN